MLRRLPLLLALAALLLALPAPAQEAPELPVFTREVLEQKDPAQRFRVEVAYPSVAIPGALMGLQANARDFNAQMKARATRVRDEFLARVREDSSLSNLPGENVLQVGYRVEANTGQLISLVFVRFQNLRGNAHPLTEVSTVNYELAGCELTLGTLFRSQDAGLAAVAGPVRAGLEEKARKNDYELFTEGLEPEADNYRNFLVARDGLHFLFNPATVAPGYVGVLEATVPWNSLEGLLSEEARGLVESFR